MALTPPVLFTSDIENIRGDEQETIGDINATFDKILETTAKDYNHAVRSVHAKRMASCRAR